MPASTNLRFDADVFPANIPALPHSSKAHLPRLSGRPKGLSPLAGRRILVTIAQLARGGDARPLGQDIAFGDALAFAAHLGALDAEVTVAAVGAPFTHADRRRISRIPGVSAWTGPAIATATDDPSACVTQLQAVADGSKAELVILHEPALAAARRDMRPTVVLCDRSRLLNWRQRHGADVAPEPVRAAVALERLGLHAADRVVATSRALAADLMALHGLTVPPAVVPPVFRRPEPHEKRGGETGLLLAGAADIDPLDVMILDRAAATICGQALLFEVHQNDAAQTLCLEQIHRLAPMTAATADTLFRRAAAFFDPAPGPGFERMVWRAAAAGCALILPDTKANREIWQGAAHLVPARSETALAAALRRMLEDDDYRRRTAAAGLRRARALSGGPAIAQLHKVLSSALGAVPLTATL